jgi:hypothetical protein
MHESKACSCEQYPVLELNNTSIYGATQRSPGFLPGLLELNDHLSGEHRLMKCPSCGQFWQVSRARLWGNLEYLFKVPEAEQSVWLEGPYIQPDEMVCYNKAIAEYINRNTWIETDSPCSHVSCGRQAVQLTIFCKQHHIEHLQASGRSLQTKPVGRLFEPYYYDSEEWAFRLKGA